MPRVTGGEATRSVVKTGRPSGGLAAVKESRSMRKHVLI